jgi:hypothetical protein
MARQAASMKKTRTRYSQAYKDEALHLLTVILPSIGGHRSKRSFGPRRPLG